MALNNTTMNLLGDHLASLLGEASLHTADPGTTGASEVTGGGYARLTPIWDAATNGGSFSLSSDLTFAGPASGACTHIGLWSADGLTFRGGFALSGDQTFNAAGEYVVKAGSSPANFTGSSS